MSDSDQLSKIRWRCRRGMLELDTVLDRFLNKHILTLSTIELERLVILLDAPDPELYDWIVGRNSHDDKEMDALVKMVGQQC
jgi:antitoxin CptB